MECFIEHSELEGITDSDSCHQISYYLLQFLDQPGSGKLTNCTQFVSMHKHLTNATCKQPLWFRAVLLLSLYPTSNTNLQVYGESRHTQYFPQISFLLPSSCNSEAFSARYCCIQHLSESNASASRGKGLSHSAASPQALGRVLGGCCNVRSTSDYESASKGGQQRWGRVRRARCMKSG